MAANGSFDDAEHNPDVIQCLESELCLDIAGAKFRN